MEALETLETLENQMLSLYGPNQKQRLFHSAGEGHRERLLMAGNRQGKSHAGGAETAIHLTGRYPDWWTGRCYPNRVRWWACGITTEIVRNVLQRKLFGDPGHIGTGFIPQNDIVNIQMSRAGGGVIDFATVQHQGGGISYISFKTYEQGWEKFTGDDIDGAWLDEEPPSDIYSEVQARTTDRRGMIYITFTPLQGITDVVSWFWPEPNAPQRHLTHMQIEDAIHIPEHRREEEISKYRAYEREARIRGIPMLGSGKVYPVEEALLVESPPDIPDHWVRLAGMDLGWDHPTAVVWAAWDRDADVLHFYDCYRQRESSVAVHASAIRGRGAWIPMAWPFDALRHESGSTEAVADLYIKEGVNMLPVHSTFDVGGYGTEAGIQSLLNRMQTGRLKVASHLEMWFDEFRMYHRKDGKIVKKRDDLMDASRQIEMMLRYAEPNKEVLYPSQVGLEWDPLNPTAPAAEPNIMQVIGQKSHNAWRH
jgi:phage terminase large subunit-like protein